MSGDGNGRKDKVISIIGMIVAVMFLWARFSPNQFVEYLAVLGLIFLFATGFILYARRGAETPKVIKPSVSAEDQEAANSSSSQHDSDEYAKSMSEQNDDNSESDDSLFGCLGSVIEGCQAIFLIFFALFMVGMIIYLLVDTAAERGKASQRSKAVQEKVEKDRSTPPSWRNEKGQVVNPSHPDDQ